MKIFLICIGSLFLICCSSSLEKEEIKKENRTAQFRYSFDDVWRATQITLQNYPIRINNTEQGIIETDWVREGEIWSLPNDKGNQAIKYALSIKVLKGEIQSRAATKVVVLKKRKKNKNFFESKSDIQGHQLEEISLLYRIKRELIIEHALNKLQQKSQ